MVGQLRARFATVAAAAPRAFWFVFCGTLINRLGGFVVPLMTIYLTKVRHVGVAEAGGVVSIFGGGSIIGSLIGGQLSDRVGRRPTMLASLYGGAIVMFALGYARDLTTITVMVGLLGVVGEMYRPAVAAFISDVIPPGVRTEAFGLFYWAINLGFAFAAMIGGLVADYDFSILFLADAITMAIYATIVAFAVPETRPAAPPARERAATGPSVSPWLDREYMVFMAISFALVLLPMQAGSALSAHMTWQGFASATYGIVMGLNGVLIILLQPIVLGALPRFDANRVLVVAALLYGLGFFVHGLAPTPPSGAIVHAAAVALWTFGEILESPTRSALIAALSPVNARGRYQSLNVMTWGAAQLLGPRVGTYIWEQSGPLTLWLACLAVGGCVAVAFAVSGPARRRRMAAAHTSHTSPDESRA